MKRHLSRMAKIMGAFLAVVIFVMITAAAARLMIRYAIYKQRVIKAPNGIDKQLIIRAGGINQFIHIRGKDMNNPVILVLHGGPGSPMTALQHKYQDKWETNFTVVNWDQRNAGKTYFLNNPDEITSSVSMEQALKDTLDVVRYLEKSLNKKKIIILGHSYGSILGTLFVQQHPQDVSAYIGAGQQICLEENNKEQYRKLLEVISEDDLKKLRSVGLSTEKDEKSNITKTVLYQTMINKYLNYAVNGNTVLYTMLSPYYTLEETKCYNLDINVTQKGIIEYLTTKGFNADTLGRSYKMPVFYILGDHDYIVPYTIAKGFYEKMDAPYKDMVVLKNAGHMMMLDQPEAFAEFLNTNVRPHVE